MTEIWKDIPGYEGLYQVSNMGRVMSLISRGKMKIRKPSINNSGYLFVSLNKNKKVKLYLVHRLVAMSFIPNPHNYPEVNHRNEIKTDNRVENLEWCSHSYNLKYGTARKRAATKRRGIFNGGNSKPVLQYSMKNELIAEYPSASEAERQIGVNKSRILKCCKGFVDYFNGNKHSALTAGGFIWHYKQDVA